MSVFPTTQVIDLQSSEEAFVRVHSEPLMNAGLLNVVRVEIPKDEEIPRHSVAESATLLCLSGHVCVGLEQEEVQVHGNQMIFLEAHQPHIIKALADSVLLITMRNPDSPRTTVEVVAMDYVDEAVEESFPASDSPAFNSPKK